MRPSKFAILLVLIHLWTTAVAASDRVLPQRILYLGNTGTERAKTFETFLKRRFSHSSVTSRDDFDPTSVDGFDVVLLDWSQRDTRSNDAVSPFGKRESWSIPVVLLGSAGHLLAGPWEVIGGSG